MDGFICNKKRGITSIENMRIKREILICGAFVLVVLLSRCRKAEPFDASQYDERYSGGVNTVFDATSKAFGNPFPGLGGHNLAVHSLGDAVFGSSFVAAPAPVDPGLGPLYNNVGCASCHHNDGTGLPTAGDAQSSLLMRISLPGMDGHGGPVPVPGYGLQLHDKAIQGVLPQCTVNITYTYQTFSLPDGSTYELRTPTYTLSNTYTALAAGYLLSPRLAPAVYGRGMLEAIPESAILANADPNDANGDGISGRPNYVWDSTTHSTQLGRFGMKANVASVLTQVASAFVNDIGITNKIFPQENCTGMPQCDGGNTTGSYNLPDSLLNAVNFYIQTLAVPARRNVTDSQVVRGKQIFIAAKCSHCHIETFTTATNVAFPPLSNQMIHPYTDLLLHDMGTGLADGRPDYEASGEEWRTAPLWGIGLFTTVNYPPYYLHDGRARSLLEAIMWHSGEAQAPKHYVQQLSTSDRNALLSFLSSL
jgi:CxxC motif-containing protein (DUF1111 family)